MSATPRRTISRRRRRRARPEADRLEDRRSGVEPDSGGFLKRHRRALLAALGAAAICGFVYYVFPEIAGLGPTLRRLARGNPWWLALGGFVEALSIGGQVVLLRGVFSGSATRSACRLPGWQSGERTTTVNPGDANKASAT
jgi:hypothetical protein